MSVSNPFEQTLALLSSSRNTAAADTLGFVLESADSACRSRGFQSLVQRADRAACKAVVRRFHLLSQQEIDSLSSIQSALIDAIDELSPSKASETTKGWISAAIALRAIHYFPQVVAVAEDHSHPLSGFAEDQILDLATQLGEAARVTRDTPSVRQPLLQSLYDSIDRYKSHRNLLLLDAFLCGSHTDDSLLRSIFADDSHKFKKLILRQLRLSQRHSILQLLADLYFRNDCPRSVAKIVRERTGQPLGIALATNASGGITNGIRRQLSGTEPPQCLSSIPIDDANIDLATRCSALLLTSFTCAPPRRVMSGIATLIESKDDCAQKTVAEILKSYDLLKTKQIAGHLGKPRSPVLSPKFSIEENDSIQSSLIRILDHFNRAGPLVRNAMKQFFANFTVDHMMQIGGEWHPDELSSYADIVSTVVSDWEEQLTNQLTSISPIRRLRSAQILRYFDLTDDLWEHCKNLCYDSNLKVRLESIDVAANSGRSDAHALLTKLTSDLSTDVQDKSSDLLHRLEIRTNFAEAGSLKTSNR